MCWCLHIALFVIRRLWKYTNFVQQLRGAAAMTVDPIPAIKLIMSMRYTIAPWCVCAPIDLTKALRGKGALHRRYYTLYKDKRTFLVQNSIEMPHTHTHTHIYDIRTHSTLTTTTKSRSRRPWCSGPVIYLHYIIELTGADWLLLWRAAQSRPSSWMRFGACECDPPRLCCSTSFCSGNIST